MRQRIIALLCLAVAADAVVSCDRASKHAEQKAKEQRTDAELAQFLEDQALRNAPLIAARNGLELKQVREVMLALHKGNLDGRVPSVEWPPHMEDRLTPLLDQIANTEQMPVKIVAQIVFDDTLLKDCSDRD